MKTLDELMKEFDGKTTIQQEEHLKKLVGAEVEVLGEIRNIDASRLELNIGDGYLQRAPLPPLQLPYGTLIFIEHKGSQLGSQLLEYSDGDGVRLATRLTRADLAPYSGHYYFDLLSIRKLNTRAERGIAQREAEQKAKKSDACFLATAAYGTADPNVVLLREYRDRILSNNFVGRSAVRFYYLASPPLARFIEVSAGRRSKARALLNPAVLLARRHLDRCWDVTLNNSLQVSAG